MYQIGVIHDKGLARLFHAGDADGAHLPVAIHYEVVPGVSIARIAVEIQDGVFGKIGAAFQPAGKPCPSFGLDGGRIQRGRRPEAAR